MPNAQPEASLFIISTPDYFWIVVNGQIVDLFDHSFAQAASAPDGAPDSEAITPRKLITLASRLIQLMGWRCDRYGLVNLYDLIEGKPLVREEFEANRATLTTEAMVTFQSESAALQHILTESKRDNAILQRLLGAAEWIELPQ